MIRLLARWRVFLGFVFAAVALWLATPTPMSLLIGAVVSLAGESIRCGRRGTSKRAKR